ncbi:hypothetical protein GIB67_027051 [Kingdonia uniflora]|uniref:Seipin n=1 Tax=Kingdonia uniflora TaxID=39325 RepID=A0A7J7P1N5_9MAGN|nr:hypothetical protein GIB67_027051 [Kingdonia uniflora]
MGEESKFPNVETELEFIDLPNFSRIKTVKNGVEDDIVVIKSEPRYGYGSQYPFGYRSGHLSPRERRNKIVLGFNGRENAYDESSKQSSASIVLANGASPLVDIDYYSQSHVFLLIELVIKAMGFQANLMIRFFTFPIWVMYYSLMLVLDPFWILKWANKRVVENVTRRFNTKMSIWNLMVRFSWGFFWSSYVCFVLFGFLVLGFVMGGVTMRYMVEEPIKMRETLNFDYTQTNPAALFPVYPGSNCGGNAEVVTYVRSRIIPPNHKLQLGISLTLPESDYNQKLGVFQVRVDFLSANGKVTATSSYPCMLKFKSLLIRYIETVLNTFPLLAGYSSESQTLNLNMRSFIEGNEPTSCLKVILEQRAEYRPGTGIPEIYAASLALDSELPLIKRVIWYWKKTIFIWISMGFFITELMLILVCCRPIIIPKVRARHRSAKGKANEKMLPLIKGS